MAVAPIGRSGVEAHLDRIERSWQQVQGRALHGASCSCCGGQPVVLDADALAASIEHALLVRARATDDACARLVQSAPRRSDEGVPAWLRRLMQADPSAALPVLALANDMLASIGPGARTRR